MTETALPQNAKLDPETLAIRARPPRAIRFKRGVIIAIAAIGSVSLIAVTWMALKPRLFQHGEWWRPFTALFLHADLQHLLGNILCGTLFASLVSRSVHALRGWLLILASGVAGNILTCLTHRGDGITSIGASTAGTPMSPR